MLGKVSGPGIFYFVDVECLRIQSLHISRQVGRFTDIWQVEDLHDESSWADACSAVWRTAKAEEVQIVGKRFVMHPLFGRLLLEDLYPVFSLRECGDLDTAEKQVCSSGSVAICIKSHMIKSTFGLVIFGDEDKVVIVFFFDIF